MDKRYQIFVSSTYSDLHKERESVIHELTRTGYIAVGMEQFSAADEEQLEYIQRFIDASDYYVVIIRGKYGSLADDGISFTEKECDYALERKKPVLPFLFKNPGKLTVDETDNDPEKLKKLNNFKKKLEAKRIVKYWEDASQLVNSIKDSIHDNVIRRPGIGWIRGDQALDPTIYKELEDARRQNKELREKLDKIVKEDIVFPSNISHGGDLFEIEYSVQRRTSDRQIIGEKCFKISWEDLFKELVNFIYSGGLEQHINRYSSGIIKSRTGEDIVTNNIQISDACIAQARYQFEALGLIEFIEAVNGNGRWKLTDKGRRYVHQLKALGRPK
jgi:hypothetical protein